MSYGIYINSKIKKNENYHYKTKVYIDILSYGNPSTTPFASTFESLWTKGTRYATIRRAAAQRTVAHAGSNDMNDMDNVKTMNEISDVDDMNKCVSGGEVVCRKKNAVMV